MTLISAPTHRRPAMTSEREAPKNRQLREWNEVLAEGETFAADLRRRIMTRKDGISRRLSLRLLRFMEAWIARGKRWRDEDIGDD